MIVKCVNNTAEAIPNELKKFAFNQDENGTVDITIGKNYDVYGIKENSYGKFYLVLTDSINYDLPWWMPSQFYKVMNEKTPKDWVLRKDEDSDGGAYSVQSYPVYFDAEEDIEDGTAKGYEVFEQMKRMKSKPVSPENT